MKLEFFKKQESIKMMFSLNSKGTLSANGDLTEWLKKKQIEEIALARDTENPALIEKGIFFCLYGDKLPENSDLNHKLITINIKYLGIRNLDMYKWNNYNEEEDGSIKFEVIDVEEGILKLVKIS